jgi:hypothetical protein
MFPEECPLNVPSEYSLNVPWMLQQCSVNAACSLNVPWMFPECSLNVPWMFPDGGTVRMNTEYYSWDTSFGLVNPSLMYSCWQVVFCVNLGTFFKVLHAVGMRAHGRPLNSYWMFPECYRNTIHMCSALTLTHQSHSVLYYHSLSQEYSAHRYY